MADSKRPQSARKPAGIIRSERKAAMGLSPEFPLFPHKSGRWAKQDRGKRHYFGKVIDDPKGERALNLWLEQKDELLAGRTPRGTREGLTVGEMCDRFLQAKDLQLEAGEITTRTRSDYEQTTDRIVAQFGKGRLVSDLASEDFEALRGTFAKTRGPVALGNEIQRVRVVFKYAYDAGLIDQPMRYGPLFKRPSRKVLRLQRAKQAPKLFEAADIQAMMKGATPQLKAMILLAINCGFGNNDCATLPARAVDLESGWIDFPRPKTGIPRRCPLWPETIKAIKDVLGKRRSPTDKAHEDLVFITAALGSFAKETADNPIAKEFAKLAKRLGLQQRGRGFYSLRHTFRTIADESRDQPACDAIMGHSDPSMAAVYRERIGDDRLKTVSDHVRQWLFPKEEKGGRTGASKARRAKKARPAASPAAAARAGTELRIVGCQPARKTVLPRCW